LISRQFSLVLSLLVVCFATSGCVPFRIPQSPAAVGTVVDAETKEPIADAHISFQGLPESQAVSDTTGYFKIESRYRTRWLPALPFDFFPPHGTMVIEAPGYQSFIFNQRTDKWPIWSKEGKGGFIWKINKKPNKTPEPTRFARGSS
jgi:hypothetical protein